MKIYIHTVFGYKVKILEKNKTHARCQLIGKNPIMPIIPVIPLCNLKELK